VIIGREELDVAAASGADPLRAACNDRESLSGFVSLLDRGWQLDVMWTGSHVASIAAVRSARADVASIDAVTWAYVTRDSPADVAGLTIVGRGPRVPTLPVIAAAGTTEDEVASWRAAISRAVKDPALRPILDTLLIQGFEPRDLDDYTRSLQPLVERFA